MLWIFQGNPNQFDIDDYLSRYTQLIYWHTNRYVKDIAVGDRVFIWRAGAEAGAIAAGYIVEAPTPARYVKHPEALGDDLWVAEKADLEALKTGIQLHEIRLNNEEGMIPRSEVKDNPILNSSTIITVPNGTVFKLSDVQANALEELWDVSLAPVIGASAIEGQRYLRAHYARERSPRLRQDKLRTFRKAHGALFCELCGFKASAYAPEPFTDRAFEVHHKNPLANAIEPVRTTLDDLAVLCANCHRAVHANENITENYEKLRSLHADIRRTLTRTP